MNPGDIVTIGAPFGDGQREYVVSGTRDTDTSYVWSGEENIAIQNFYLTKVGEGGSYQSPHEDESEWWMTVGAFRGRFTTEEKIAIELRSLDDPSAGEEARKMSAAIRAAEKDAQASKYISLKDARTINGIAAYVAFGLLEPYRAGEILNTKPTEIERYYA